MTHEEHKEALALAALGGDVGAERADALEVHLAACGECREELRELSDAAAMLALSPAPVSPSPELRSRILTQIKTIPQERNTAAAATQTSDASAGAFGATTTPEGSASSTANATTAARPAADTDIKTDAATADERAAAANVVPFAAKRREEKPARRARHPALLFGYLAASLAIAALALSLVTLWQRNNQLREELARVSTQLDEARSQLTNTRTEMARVRGEAELLSAPDSHVAVLTGTESAAGARARLTFNETTGDAVLVASKLPPPPAGKAYQLWYIAGNRPLPGPVFTTDASGRGRLRDTIPPEGLRATLFAVTLEQSGGAAAPTGSPYLAGPAS